MNTELPGDRLTIAKKQLKLNNEELGAVIGVSHHAVSKAIKRNRLNPFHLDIFEKEFGISRKWIETGEGEMTLNEQTEGRYLNMPELLILDQLEETGKISKAEIEILRERIIKSFKWEKAIENLKKGLNI